MAQSVVEVMEDSKGKVHENLLANGGRSTTGFSFYGAIALTTATMEALNIQLC